MASKKEGSNLTLHMNIFPLCSCLHDAIRICSKFIHHVKYTLNNEKHITSHDFFVSALPGKVMGLRLYKYMSQIRHSYEFQNCQVHCWFLLGDVCPNSHHFWNTQAYDSENPNLECPYILWKSINHGNYGRNPTESLVFSFCLLKGFLIFKLHFLLKQKTPAVTWYKKVLKCQNPFIIIYRMKELNAPTKTFSMKGHKWAAGLSAEASCSNALITYIL